MGKPLSVVVFVQPCVPMLQSRCEVQVSSHWLFTHTLSAMHAESWHRASQSPSVLPGTSRTKPPSQYVLLLHPVVEAANASATRPRAPAICRARRKRSAGRAGVRSIRDCCMFDLGPSFGRPAWFFLTGPRGPVRIRTPLQHSVTGRI